MAQGLLSQAQPQEQAMPAQQQQMMQEQQPPGADRQQMAELEDMVQIARNIVYEKAIFDEIVERAKSDRVGALAEAAVAVIAKLEESGRQVTPESALGIGIALIADIADVLTQAGMPDFSQEELMGAVQGAVTLYLKTNEGKVDPQQLQAGMQELQGAMGGML